MSIPKLVGLLETAIYVDDMTRACAFYREVMAMRAMLETPRLTAFDAGSGGVLLIFARGQSLDDMPGPEGVIPGHDGAGPLHLAFGIRDEDVASWRARLETAGVAIRSEVAWPRGGRSLYFDDPDGHVVELATRGLWPNDRDRPA
ncbi:MAG: VOC family protein [Sphingomonas adhaesiva]|uniref:VOC family protein n=1 Tax=Sphingomonas adhaesiva TaxID=28212 RepID=UPI002FF8E049